MRAARNVLEYLIANEVQHIFGIPAGSVNAFFDELYDMPELTPIVAKHEGAASYMAAAYAKYTNQLSVCIGCSGPGATNLVTGAANAMREHLPVLFITGAVPMNTVGLNASQELDVEPVFRSVTKYSVTVNDVKDVLKEVALAIEIALSGVPGPVHVAIPIDIQHENIEGVEMPPIPKRLPIVPDLGTIKETARELVKRDKGYIFAGQGIRNSVESLIELAELLNWPIITTPQAKGYIPEEHPLLVGVFGFAGHEAASALINEGDGKALLIVGSSLGETATNNYNGNLIKDRFSVQMDFDQSVFNRKYNVDIPVLGDINLSLLLLIEELKALGLQKESAELTAEKKKEEENTEEYNTKNVLLTLQKCLPSTTRYTIDIGEFMAYVIHHMKVIDFDSYNINVHFGAMGSGIGSAIGSKLAEPERPVVCITGDGCFFMHGMEILTAKEYNLPILFVVMNNARLGMVYHGHSLQFRRTHPSFEQESIHISAMAAAMNIPSYRITELEDIDQDVINGLMNSKGPAVLEVALVDNNTPPMGDRVKFLSSFGK
ncbi:MULTISPECIES: thiamine pyrophosphate-binding protein [Bacillus cereus group]|uniref:thiamine pyrophosphate-binding protein n=1 Tax=Bacillus cereus group TaxID=86661 RepID=UPI0008FDA379|nr:MULTISPECIES: thiamine pyrophosphate-binding protein [Bacillus cereus group]MDG1617914.1 thiamine pyrophosphate-binding protein [Bacillus mobilis]MDX5837921.1 thiamine pyrophosphate-binding protein [Bacillus cereus group sp. BfR-BA-01700]MED4386830.1 thiamine pyrophosphate-binding protein [Bacillus mobilis]NEK99000.1 thiamine pyrophosphate-binding protein [Bacillus mobilis]OJE38402.1 acetolactate synthase [Bacillus mobilis]